MIAAYQPLRDGGGPVIWTLLRSELYSMDLCGLGAVRLVDMYCGRGAGARGKWCTWTEMEEYYFTEGLDGTWQRRAKAAYGEVRKAVAEHEEASAWLRWFAGQMDHDGPPAEAEGTQLRVQARRDGWSIEELLDAKESGRAEEPIEYLCKWHLHDGAMEPTWEGEATVRSMWQEHRRPPSTEMERSEEARAAMSSVRGQVRGVGKFKMLWTRLKRSWAQPGAWTKLRDARRTSTRARMR